MAIDKTMSFKVEKDKNLRAKEILRTFKRGEQEIINNINII